jgi:hypothetical protein
MTVRYEIIGGERMFRPPVNLSQRGWRMIGTLIQASAAPQAVAQIIQAEQAGVSALWATSGGFGFGLVGRGRINAACASQRRDNGW